MAKGPAEKIDFLMKLTNTQNAMLARTLNFDASYISRIRSGKRGLPPGQPFVAPACAFFVKRIREEYQRRALSEEIGLGRPWPEDRGEAQALLESWIVAKQPGEAVIERMVAALTVPPRGVSAAEGSLREPGGIGVEAHLFYGNDGKREGVLSFLAGLCATESAHTLLLHSDEDMTWLYEDEGFVRQWEAMLAQLADRGSRIKIIHAISRNANEMWEAAQKWLPIYMSGAVEPYYYPHLRDGIFRRTLFVAPGHSAMTASSVQNSTEGTLSLLLDDQAAVTALEGEFYDYLALCRPLMEVVYPSRPQDLIPLLAVFAQADDQVLATFDDGKVICARESGRALLANVGTPLVAFGIEEPRMASTVWEYLLKLPGDVRQDEDAVALLEELASRLSA